MSERLKNLILNELAALNYSPTSDKRIKIHCPFHSDSNPSLNVALAHPRLPPGSFKCFSCGEKGGWNKLAERLKLKLHDEDMSQYYDKSKGYEDDPFKDLGLELKVTGNEQIYIRDGIEDLPEDFSWRGLPRQFWVDLNCAYYWDFKRDLFYIYMPMTMFGNQIGYTIAAVDPKPRTPEEKIAKYQTFAQTEQAILLYDQLIPMSTIVIVEGHFDAWRMKAFGFNVCAMIGTENWSKYKTAAILAKMPKRIILCLDGDEAGYKAGDMLNQIFFNEGIDVVYYKLPLIPKPNALDPGNMPIEYIEDMRRYVI
jgi:5S rRNA maturation endonuclease (ribonuclease M5)